MNEWKNGYKEGFADGYAAAKKEMNYTNFPPVYYATMPAGESKQTFSIGETSYVVNTPAQSWPLSMSVDNMGC